MQSEWFSWSTIVAKVFISNYPMELVVVTSDLAEFPHREAIAVLNSAYNQSRRGAEKPRRT